MARFLITDLKTIEMTPTSPAILRAKIGDMILHSTVTRAKVEAINTETGEYRVILQGTLDREENRWED
jgi:hypothetical protein